MKTISSIALIAALAFACPAVAQEVNAGAATGAAAGATGSATSGSTTGSGSATGTVNADGSVSVTPDNASLDVNGDGSISVEEQAAAGGSSGQASGGATGSAGAGTTVNADANNDGTISAEEQAAADAAAGAAGTVESCDEANIGAMAAVDAAMIAAATNVRVQLLSECDDTVAGAPDHADALAGNTAVSSALQGSSLTTADVVAVAMEGDTLVLYAESASDTDGQSSDTTTTTTTSN